MEQERQSVGSCSAELAGRRGGHSVQSSRHLSLRLQQSSPASSNSPQPSSNTVTSSSSHILTSETPLYRIQFVKSVSYSMSVMWSLAACLKHVLLRMWKLTPVLQMAGGGQSWQKDAADQNFDYMFKLLIIGNSSVGKTSFLFRYADDSFTSAFVSTVGIDFKVKTVFRQDKRVKLQIWVSFNLLPCL